MQKTSWEKQKPGFFKRIKSKFTNGLIMQAITNQLQRIGIHLIPYYWVQEGINKTELPDIKGQESDFQVQFLTPEEIKKLGTNPWGDTVDKQLADLDSGKKCIGLKHNDEIASFMWISFNECTFKPAANLLNDDEVYLSRMYTMKSYRGKNLAPYLRYKSYEFIKEMGRDKIFSTTEYFNPAASRYKEKLNARKIRLILYIGLFKKIKWNLILKTY